MNLRTFYVSAFLALFSSFSSAHIFPAQDAFYVSGRSMVLRDHDYPQRAFKKTYGEDTGWERYEKWDAVRDKLLKQNGLDEFELNGAIMTFQRNSAKKAKDPAALRTELESLNAAFKTVQDGADVVLKAGSHAYRDSFEREQLRESMERIKDNLRVAHYQATQGVQASLERQELRQQLQQAVAEIATASCSAARKCADGSVSELGRSIQRINDKVFGENSNSGDGIIGN